MKGMDDIFSRTSNQSEMYPAFNIWYLIEIPHRAAQGIYDIFGRAIQWSVKQPNPNNLKCTQYLIYDLLLKFPTVQPKASMTYLAARSNDDWRADSEVFADIVKIASKGLALRNHKSGWSESIADETSKPRLE